jgi:acetoin utilization deacetylase AcuC-like enzyme
VRVSYSPGYWVTLPQGHPFPMGKFPALHAILLRDGLIRPQDVAVPYEVSWEDLQRVHDRTYLQRLREGTLDRRQERRLGLPWSAALVRRSRLAVQGTLNAARLALEDGIAANLAGGTHHAFAEFGEGFCVLNDMGVAVRVLQSQGRLERALIIDLDVHQGNGTAAVFAGDRHVFTFSMHGQRNFPFKKEQSSRDVGLDDGVGDDEYNVVLARHLPEIMAVSRPQLIFYLAGVDPVAGDRYGRLALSEEGIARRDRQVLETARGAGVPLVLLLSGGYAPTPEKTAELHAIVHRQAAMVYG